MEFDHTTNIYLPNFPLKWNLIPSIYAHEHYLETLLWLINLIRYEPVRIQVRIGPSHPHVWHDKDLSLLKGPERWS
jgi:hypothetical protein